MTDAEGVIDLAEERREFVTDVDGYAYWWPLGSTRGHLSAWHLRCLADELDRRNKPWDDQVRNDLDRLAAMEPR